MPLGVILSEVSNANEVEGSRTADELARRPEDQRDEGSSSRKRTRYPVREALLGFATVSQGSGSYADIGDIVTVGDELGRGLPSSHHLY